jgi:hypothetical protein
LQIKKFDIEFGKKKKKASCEAFQAGHSKHLMYRVYVPDNEWGEVYIFYLTDKVKRRFFWYRLHDSRDRIAFTIARALRSFKEIRNVVDVKNY